MTRHLRSCALLCGLAFPLSLAVGCDFGKDKTVVPLIQEVGAAPDPASLKRAKKHGPALWWREHATHLAVDRGLLRVGATVNKVLLPIAEVDREFHSASVTFYRWPKLEDGESMTGGDAQRWLVVPILLRPDRVLENEQFNDYLEDKSARAREVDAVILVGAKLLAEYPSGRWHMHPVREGTDKNPSRHVRTRVYAIAANGSGPDVELLIADAKADAKPEILAKTVVHEIGHWQGEELHMKLNAPTAMSVARVLEKGELARTFTALGADGSKWSIDAETGAIESIAPTTEELEDAEDESPPTAAPADEIPPPPSDPASPAAETPAEAPAAAPATQP